MKLHFAIAIVFPVLAAQAADVQSEFAIGRTYYQDERSALSVRSGPTSPESAFDSA